MKKILNLLEQHVQWLAFVAGAAYVIYMFWVSFAVAPVTVAVPELTSEPLKPGEVDPLIEERLVAELENKIQSTRVPPALTPPDYVKTFGEMMNFSGKFAGNAATAWTADTNVVFAHGAPRMGDAIPEMQGNPGTVSTPTPGPAVSAVVSRLPSLPAAKITATRTGLTHVLPEQLVAAGAISPPAPAGSAGADKCWVTVRFELDPAVIAQEWEGAKIPERSGNTTFIQVTLMRQEMKPDGKWSDEVPIPTLAALKLQPFPAPNAPAADSLTYLKWAEQNVPEILQPRFYAKIKGDDWAVPGEEGAVAAAPVVPAAAFDPQNYIDMLPDEVAKAGLTLEQRRLVQQAKEKRRQEQSRGAGRGGARRSGGPAPAADPGEIVPAPIDMGRPVNYQPVEENLDLPVEPATVGGSAGKGKFAIPVGQFNPTVWAKAHVNMPIIGWAHDETAVEGIAYRYRVVYKLKNPVFVTPQVVQDPKLAEPFALVSAPSEWSPTVEVASTIRFFVANPPRTGATTVTLEVFRWKGGEPRSKQFQVAVGDIIGTNDGDVDYATGWTVVDFPTDGRYDYVLLMDPQGNLRRRDSRTDAQDPKYQELKKQTAAQRTAAAAAP